ncbi:hypothetical protein PVK06_006887 [Gossypium arboreum]|uniref:DUF4283 domain-containing protein n=1 Tax=Gossypium arboreum TaxID=29729 RepID=A0ABR0QG31_GOSAR|nr:hypothetical protein PVK06_006887 [Gossypium arboreum]
MDLNRVLNGAPWTFKNYLLVIHCMENGENPLKVLLTHVWLDVRHPLRRKKRLMFALGKCSYVVFRFERLTCFVFSAVVWDIVIPFVRVMTMSNIRLRGEGEGGSKDVGLE